MNKTARHKSYFVLAILMLFCSAITFAQNSASPVSVKLSLANGKDVYRAGETIRLILSFTTDRPGFDVQMDRETYLDRILISPKDGLFDWKTDYYGGDEPASDSLSFTEVSGVPSEIKVSLNDYYRFDGAGKYTVRLITKRVREKKVGGQAFDSEKATEITTNAVSFEITPMSDAEEAAEAKRLGAAIELTKDFWEQVQLAEELANLPGAAAIPEKIARYQWATKQNAGNFAGALQKGLFLSRNRVLVIRKLEDILSDVSKAVDFQLVGNLSSLRAREMIAASGKLYKRSSWYEPGPQDDLYPKANEYYLKVVIDSLPKREGKNLIDTAYGLLWTQHDKLAPDLLASVRGILLKNFDSLDIFAREQLLGARWEQIRDPSLVSSLERMLKEKGYPDYGRLNVHTTAITRLIELDKLRARPFVIDEIQDPESVVYDDAIDGLDDKFLPEADEAILQLITKFGQPGRGNTDSVRLRAKCLMAARYATGNIYDQLLDVYKKYSGGWYNDTKGILMGYFLRHKPKEALLMLEEESKAIDKELRGTFFYDATRKNFPDEAAVFFEKRLMSSDPQVVINAVYLLSLHGSAKDRTLIEARLDQWLKEWANRPFELEGPQMKPSDAHQAMLQVELILALRQGKAWKLTGDELKKLTAKCVTQVCHQNFPERLGK